MPSFQACLFNWGQQRYSIRNGNTDRGWINESEVNSARYGIQTIYVTQYLHNMKPKTYFYSLPGWEVEAGNSNLLTGGPKEGERMDSHQSLTNQSPTGTSLTPPLRISRLLTWIIAPNAPTAEVISTWRGGEKGYRMK